MAVKKIPVISVILAGGRGVRMGGIGKASILLGDIPLIQHVINRINKQVDNIVISGSLTDKDINNLGYEVIPDIFTENGGSGPLSGKPHSSRCSYGGSVSPTFPVCLENDGRSRSG